jgi:hypothetical protein
MYMNGVLNIQPEFQREIVWKGPAQTRFLDSLIKQLPIPSLCFSMDFKAGKWQVIDGLQRMASIIRFLGGDPSWTLSRLDDVDPELGGKPAKDFLNPESPLNKYFQRVENLTLPITVLRCDYSKKQHTRYLFTIFHRLNTGAMRLNNQEIRNCIYSGPFNELLNELNNVPEWMKLNRMKKDAGYRFTKQELILRVFAFNDNYENYGGRLARFLNDYMDDKKALSPAEAAVKRSLFTRTVSAVFHKVYNGSAPGKTPLSVVEATMVGIARNIVSIEKMSVAEVEQCYHQLLKHDEFSDQKLLEGLAGKTRVIGRMKAAIDAFAA